MQHQIEETLRKSIAGDFETKLRHLEQNNKDNEEKLKQARQQQLDFLKKEQELKNKEAELELSVQKKLQEEREKLAAGIRKLEEQRIAAKETEFQLRIKEMEEKLQRLIVPRHDSKRPILIYAGNLKKEVIEADFYDTIINFEEFFN